jgi:hypothetical protein
MPRSNVKEKPGKPGPQIPGPQVKTTSSSLGSGLVDSMVSGFGFGIGNTLAKSLFEPKISSEPKISPNPNLNLNPSPVTPDNIFKEYLECLERNESTTNCELLLNIKS